MCVHLEALGHANCSSDFTSETSTRGGSYNRSDSESYEVEFDIRADYHMVMSRNSTYDNVSNHSDNRKNLAAEQKLRT
jgi:hypothetical protein